MIREIAAGFAGLVAASLVVMAVEALAHGQFKGDALFVAVAIGYGLGALAGSTLATMIAWTRWPAIIVAVVLALLGIVNLFAIDHPIWFVPVAVIVLAAGWWIGTRVVRSRGEG